MLHITRMPEPGSGGDTLFANMHLAYDMLSPKLKELLTGLTAIHDGAHAFRGHKIPEGYEPPASEHPVVVRHPETDRPLLYVNPAYTSHIPQLSADESRAVLDLLFSIVPNRPMLACRVRWEPNTLVFWDNRCVQHHATYDYYPHTRFGHRVAINGGPLKG
jgi:taurine dioxygenase